MSIGNLIRKNDKFDKEYIAEVMSNEDSLQRGRLQVKVPTLMGDIPFWVNATLVTGSVNFLIVPDPGDKVNVKFKNKDIYSGEWELKGMPDNSSNIDPNKYGLKDANGNTIIVDKTTNEITIESKSTITIKGTSIIIDGNTSITGTLDVTGQVSISSNTAITGDLDATGKITANDAEISLGSTVTTASTVKAYKGIVKNT